MKLLTAAPPWRHTLLFLALLALLLAGSAWSQTTTTPAPPAPPTAGAPLVAPAAPAAPAAPPSPVTVIVPPAPETTLEAPPVVAPAPDPFTMTLPIFGRSLFRRARTEAQPAQAAPVSPAYVLGPADVLLVRLWTGNLLQISGEVPVSNEGDISLDNAGQIRVQGLSLAAARTLLQQRYTRLYQDFTLEVNVAQMRTVDVFVIGEVAQPGKYSLPGNATIFTALFAAGGPTETGSLRSLRLTRADQPPQIVDLYDYLLQGQRVADIPLQPGDTLFVPLVGSRVGVAGAVKRPAEYELKGAQSLTQVLAMAGGLLPRAYAPRVQVRRFAGNQNYQTQDVDLAQPGVATAFLLQDGDRVVAEEVTDLVANAITLDGPVYRPGTYQLRPGLTVGALLLQAEGLTPAAYGQWATLRRLNPKTAQYEDLAISPLLALQGEAGYDLPLQTRDQVIIYDRTEIEGEIQVIVKGQVRLPGAVDYNPGMTVRDALLKAGGLIPGALVGRAQLLRVRPDMTREVLAVNLEKALAGEAAHNLALRPRDQLLVAAQEEVGAAPLVMIDGQVNKPGEYPRYENMKVSDLLATAGGVLPGANGLVKITHGRYTDNSETETVTFTVGASLPQVTPDPALRDDDFVAVMGATEFVQAPAAVQVLGQIENPGPYALLHPTAHPESVWDLVQRAGGLLNSAYGPGILVYRQVDDMLIDPQREQYQHVIRGLDETQRELKLETATRPAAGGPVISGAAAPAVPSPRPAAPVVPPEAVGATTAPVSPVVPASSSAAAAATLTPTPIAPGATVPAEGITPVAAPTPVPAPAPTPVEQVTLGLAQAFSTQNAVTIVVPPRELAAGTFARAIPVDWKRIQATEGKEGDIILHDGDVVYIPTTPSLVMVAGAVRNQGPIRYERGLTVQRAIDQAGGLAKDAILRQTIVIRLNGQTIPVRSKEAVQPGDIIIVPTHYIIQTARVQSGWERILAALGSLALTFRAFF